MIDNCFHHQLIEYILKREMFDRLKSNSQLLSLLVGILSFIPAAIASYVYSQFVLRFAYLLIGEKSQNGEGVTDLLEVGTSNGNALKTISGLFRQARILGIDHNRHQVDTAKQLFQGSQNVQIKHMDFNDLEKKQPDSLFDLIVFRSSKLMLPHETKTIEITKRKLRRGGKIYIILKLNQEKSAIGSIVDQVKPYLKYITNADFDPVTYQADFQDFLTSHQLKINFSERLDGNIFLKLSNYWLYEVTKA